ncbi:hypothetical protein [uncultured Methylibium sp.]|uniref:hypothetical protein n=1 Tax=uncultured Methylibium sp. TaxID=381093 RepID=UPI0025FC4CD9|nr:hypothetical protein [uncultured Methylibium sp.]
MSSSPRFSLASQMARLATAPQRDSGFGGLGPAATGKGQVLPTRSASRQLELPFVMPAALPRQRLRTG